MSATGRNDDRDENDYYPTPEWCVHRFLEKINLSSDRLWLEPTAGDGSIIRAVKSFKATGNLYNCPSSWKAVELQSVFEPLLRKETKNVTIGDFLKFEPRMHGYPKFKADVCIGNPPYNLALPIIKHSMSQTDTVCMLLRLNFLASGKRCDWMQKNTPDVYVLPNRPSFRGKGTDATEYAWFVWSAESKGKLKILNLTSREVRSKDKKRALAIIEEYKKMAA